MKSFLTAACEMVPILSLPIFSIFVMWLLTFGSFDLLATLRHEGALVANIICWVLYIVAVLIRADEIREGGNQWNASSSLAHFCSPSSHHAPRLRVYPVRVCTVVLRPNLLSSMAQNLPNSGHFPVRNFGLMFNPLTTTENDYQQEIRRPRRRQ